MATPQIINRIRKEIIESGRDTRYHTGGYEYVLNGIEFYITSIGEKRHVGGGELTQGLLVFAQKQFGPLARTVLKYWGISKTDDIGNIVYNMISLGIMSKQPDDTIEHFHEVTDLNRYFRNIQYFTIDKETVKKIKGA